VTTSSTLKERCVAQTGAVSPSSNSTAIQRRSVVSIQVVLNSVVNKVSGRKAGLVVEVDGKNQVVHQIIIKDTQFRLSRKLALIMESLILKASTQIASVGNPSSIMLGSNLRTGRMRLTVFIIQVISA